MTDHSPEKDLSTQIQYRLIEKLSESEKRYRDLVEILGKLSLNVSDLAKITFLNQAWSNTLGYSVSETLTMPLGNFVVSDDRSRFAQMLVNLETDQRTSRLLRFSPSERSRSVFRTLCP